MSAIVNLAIRRHIATTLPRNVAAPSAGEHSGGYKLWKRLTFFVAFPCVGLCMLNTYLKHQEDHANHHRPEFVKYDYLVRREKRFPWGDGNRTLFHNPRVNPLPDGYED